MSDEVLSFPADWVRVTVTVPVTGERMWETITDPGRVACWFGTLAEPWRSGAGNRVDFGDGDFFDVEVDEVRHGDRVTFRWRFLGVGPECLITWHVSSSGTSSTLTVDDSSPGRSAPETAQLKAGWLDFVSRLADHLATGRPTRYEWRQEIDGSVLLPAGDWHPLRPETIVDWLPTASDAAGPSWFFVVDEEGPRRFAVHDWHLVPQQSLSFTVEIPDGHVPTTCRVWTDRAERGVTLSVAHHGWGQLHVSDLQRRQLRHRFAAAWTAALTQAEECGRSRQEL